VSSKGDVGSRQRNSQLAQTRKNRLEAGFFLPCSLTAYWLAPEAGAAAEAAAPASEAAVVAEAAASLAAAAAPEAAAAESEAAAAAGAEAAAASLAGAAAWSLLLLHAASATAANRDATRRDFFMITSFYG
jgi:hypothetical protein